MSVRANIVDSTCPLLKRFNLTTIVLYLRKKLYLGQDNLLSRAKIYYNLTVELRRAYLCDESEVLPLSFDGYRFSCARS